MTKQELHSRCNLPLDDVKYQSHYFGPGKGSLYEVTHLPSGIMISENPLDSLEDPHKRTGRLFKRLEHLCADLELPLTPDKLRYLWMDNTRDYIIVDNPTHKCPDKVIWHKPTQTSMTITDERLNNLIIERALSDGVKAIHDCPKSSSQHHSS